jgi:hypothetical protein
MKPSPSIAHLFPPIVACLMAALVVPAVLAAPKPEDEPTEEAEGAAPAAVVSWVKPVSGWVPVKPGEHPRLFFRKSDLPALRARMQTPEGKAILARLRATLGGGEAMPTIYSPATVPYARGGSQSIILKQEGAYTISHAAGFGFLYQLTGQTKYADLARQCVEKAIAGQRDRDDRYSLVLPGGQLRAGPSLAWYAAAYDLCYDAWPADFRQQVASALLTFNDKQHMKDLAKANPQIKDTAPMDLFTMSTKPRHSAASNHFGSIVGGTAIALLALQGDPGVDPAMVETGLANCERRILQIFTTGFGDAGWFAEGPGPSHMASNPALGPALQAFKVAAGRDFTQQPSVQWMTLRWAYDLIAGKDGRPRYPCRMIGGNAGYGTDDFLGPEQGGGMSHGGWFSQGFGIIPEAMKPALLWTWQNVVRGAMHDNYDTANYPHRAMLAFINWPIGVAPKNPGELLPHIRHDTVHGYLSTRNRWKDSDDIILSVWAQSGPRGWIGRKTTDKSHTSILVHGGGHRFGVGGMGGAAPWIGWQRPDGSAAFTNGGSMVAIDFSGQAGVDALVVSRERDWKMRTPDTAFVISDRDTRLDNTSRIGITSLSPTGIHPRPRKGEGRVVVGAQTIVMENGLYAFQPLPGAAPGMGENPIDAKAVNSERLAREDIPAKEVVLPADPPLLHIPCDTIMNAGGKPELADLGQHKLKVEIVGKPTLEPGVLGQAISLNGADELLLLPANPALDLQGRSVTISLWLQVSGGQTGEEVVLLEKNRWRGSKTPDCYSFVIDPTNRLMFNTPAINTSQPGFAVGWADQKWHHAACTFDAATAMVSLYFDGSLIQSKKTREGGSIGAGSAPLTIGARGVGAEAGNHFPGLLDEIRVYDRALTRGEIRALFNQGAPKPAVIP